MFEDNVITVQQWCAIMRLELKDVVYKEYVEETRTVLGEINAWVEANFGLDDSFLIIGV